MKPNLFTLGGWAVNPQKRTIERDGKSEVLQPKLMALLVSLASAWPAFRTREELIAEIWGVEHISPQALNNAVSKLRQLLGDDPRRPEFIITERARGYALLAEPAWLEAAPARAIWKRPVVWAGSAALVAVIMAGTA